MGIAPIGAILVEREGFEPPELLHPTDYKSAALDHSAISGNMIYCLSILGEDYNKDINKK